MRISASQIQMFLNCKASWYYAYVKGIKQPERPGLEFGKKFHEAVEDYIRLGKIQSDDPKIINMIAAGRSRLDMLQLLYNKRDSACVIEKECAGMIEKGVDYLGYIDFLMHDKKDQCIVIVDFKTVADWRYMKSSEELKTNIQMMFYAWHILKEHPTVNSIQLCHDTFCKAGKGTAKPRTSETLVSRQEALEFFQAHILPVIYDMQTIAEWSEVPTFIDKIKNTESCGFYGGCPYRPSCIGNVPWDKLKESFDKGEVMNFNHPFFSGSSKAVEEPTVAPVQDKATALFEMFSSLNKEKKEEKEEKEAAPVLGKTLGSLFAGLEKQVVENKGGMGLPFTLVSKRSKPVILIDCIPMSEEYMDFSKILWPYVTKIMEGFSNFQDIRLIPYNEGVKNLIGFTDSILSDCSKHKYIYVSKDVVCNYAANNIFNSGNAIIIKGV